MARPVCISAETEAELFGVRNVQGLQAPTHLLKPGSSPLHMVDILREMQLLKVDMATAMSKFSSKILGCVTSLLDHLAQPHAAAGARPLPTVTELGAIQGKARAVSAFVQGTRLSYLLYFTFLLHPAQASVLHCSV